MSQENVEVVRSAIEAGNRRDLQMGWDLWDPNAEVDWSRSNGPLKGVYRGREEIERLLTEFWSAFDRVETEAHEYTPVGSQVVVPNTAHMRGRDGVEVTAKSTFVYTIEDGQVTRLVMFNDLDEALEAAEQQQ